jgi:hypothetical protein
MVELRPIRNLMEEQPASFRPLGISPSTWTEAIIVAVRKPLFRQCQIRIRFLAELPYELFKPLVFGRERSCETADPEAPEHETDHFWR